MAQVIETGTEVILAEVRGRVGVVTLNRPERMNALHHEMYPAIKSLLTKWATDDQVAVVVFTGAGKGFCSGGDVQDGRVRKGDTKPTTDERIAALYADALTTQAIWEFPKITVAAVNGPAVGAGMSLALCCDLRIASTSAKFVSGWGALAFSGDFGGTWFLTRLLGPGRTIEFLASGQPLSAETLNAYGVYNKVVSQELFANEWPKWVAAIAEGPLGANISMKANVRDALFTNYEDYLPLETRRMVTSSMTQEHRDAVKRWLEARNK